MPTRPADDVDHTLRCVLRAEVGRFTCSAAHAVPRLLGAPLVATPLGVDVDHSFRGVLKAELANSGAARAERRVLGTAMVAALRGHVGRWPSFLPSFLLMSSPDNVAFMKAVAPLRGSIGVDTLQSRAYGRISKVLKQRDGGRHAGLPQGSGLASGEQSAVRVVGWELGVGRQNNNAYANVGTPSVLHALRGGLRADQLALGLSGRVQKHFQPNPPSTIGWLEGGACVVSDGG